MKFKKYVLPLATVFVLSACSSMNPFTKAEDKLENVTEDSVKLVQDFGKVEVTFDRQGEWELIKSSATAATPVDHVSGLEQAMNVAVLRAKRNIAEFLNEDLRSSKNVEVVTTALAKNTDVKDQGKSKEEAADIAHKLNEKIVSESKAILRGVYIVERKVTDDKQMVTVTVAVDKKSLRASKQITSSVRN